MNARRLGDEGGFSLIEVIVALALLLTVMGTTAGFFVSSLKQSDGQTQAQEAAVLADQQLDYTRSVAASSLVSGRTQTAVQAAIAKPGAVNLSQDVTATGNYDPSATDTSSQAVPITMTNKVGATTYTITTFIDQCYAQVAANQTCTATDSGSGWIYRITVGVSYKLGGGRSCGASGKPCEFVVSTLRDPGTDACFNVNVEFAGCSALQPTIATILPTAVATNTTTTITLTGANFDPGATVSLDTGATVSNVTRISSTSLTFTLVTDNSPAAVGTRTLKLTNPNGKFAYGTITVTTSAVTVNTVTPSPVTAGSTVSMTVTGSGFQNGAAVSIPTTAGTIVGSPAVTANAITLTFTAGSGATSVGTWPVTVTNPDGNSDSANFTINQATLTVTAVSPSTMTYGSTPTFTLTGSGFNSGAQVSLDGANVSASTISPTAISLTLGSDPAAGTHTFTVTNPDGGSDSVTFAVTSGRFSRISSLSTTSIRHGRTASVTIIGTGFVRSGPTTPRVTVNGSSAGVSSVNVSSATKVTFRYTITRTRGTYTYPVQVTSKDGTVSDVFNWVVKSS